MHHAKPGLSQAYARWASHFGEGNERIRQTDCVAGGGRKSKSRSLSSSSSGLGFAGGEFQPFRLEKHFVRSLSTFSEFFNTICCSFLSILSCPLRKDRFPLILSTFLKLFLKYLLSPFHCGCQNSPIKLVALFVPLKRAILAIFHLKFRGAVILLFLDLRLLLWLSSRLLLRERERGWM